MDENGGADTAMSFKVTVGQIVDFLVKEKLAINGESTHPYNREQIIIRPIDYERALPGEVSWTSEYSKEKVQNFDGSLLICPVVPDFNQLYKGKTIQCRNPKLAMAKVLNKFFAAANKYPMRWLQRSPMINWEESTIQNAEIGSRVIIGPNCCIGIAGQGYAETDDGYYHFPHLGMVIIDDDVTIGANTVICRGALSNTVIGKGTKIGNQVNIGHNVTIGKNVMIIAGAVICGSVEIGDNAWIGPGAKILNKIKIGKGARVGIGAVVVKDVSDGKKVIGNPARAIG